MITILTPTYNRAHTLPRLFTSLLKQAPHNFEWVIIDDGSSDKTAELVNSFRERAPFPIVLKQQQNSGKHIALNRGLKYATKEWIFIVDSDDWLPTQALKKVTDTSKIYTARTDVAGFCYRKATANGEILGITPSNLPREWQTTPTTAGRKLKGDLAYIFRRSAMLKEPFPRYKEEKFVPELYVWNRISDNGGIIFFPYDCIYLCEYLPDGYTKNFKRMLKNNPKGFLLFYSSQIQRESNLINKVKMIIRSLQCLYYIKAKE